MSNNTLIEPVRRVYVLYGEDDTQKDEAVEFLQSILLDSTFSDFDSEKM